MGMGRMVPAGASAMDLGPYLWYQQSQNVLCYSYNFISTINWTLFTFPKYNYLVLNAPLMWKVSETNIFFFLHKRHILYVYNM